MFYGDDLTFADGSLSARRAWIEIDAPSSAPYAELSLSARRAWIEIIDDFEPSSTRKVALRKESVDRNFNAVQIIVVIVVALRKESVDRNMRFSPILKGFTVALRKESVDRNAEILQVCPMMSVSRSPQGERG